MKWEYGIEEMVQSAAPRADREIQERRACAEGQCGICCVRREDAHDRRKMLTRDGNG